MSDLAEGFKAVLGVGGALCCTFTNHANPVDTAQTKVYEAQQTTRNAEWGMRNAEYAKDYGTRAIESAKDGDINGALNNASGALRSVDGVTSTVQQIGNIFKGFGR
jgi:hypothetical protein